MSEREWKWGKNDFQEYFETKEAGRQWACVFRNIPSNIWVVMVENAQGGHEMLLDKERNDEQRRAQDLPEWAPVHELHRRTLLSIEQGESGDASCLVLPLMRAAEDALTTGNREYVIE